MPQVWAYPQVPASLPVGRTAGFALADPNSLAGPDPHKSRSDLDVDKSNV